MSSPETPPADAQRWRIQTALVSALVVLCLAYIVVKIVHQVRCNSLVSRLSGPQWQQARSDLVRIGESALPYVVRAFYYDFDTTVRRRAGGTLIESIGKLEKPSGPALARWQEKMRAVCESDMVTKALRDEDPQVRALAGKIAETIGFEHAVETGRYQRWQNLEKLLATLRQDPKKEVDAVLRAWRDEDTVGEFGNSVLVGIIAEDPDPAMRRAATRMLEEMLASAYRADDREEMVKLVGHRRLRVLLRLLAEGAPDAEKLLSYSPNVNRYPKLVPGIRDALRQEIGKPDFEKALTRWKDIYGDIEEGQKGVLRSRPVAALVGEVKG